MNEEPPAHLLKDSGHPLGWDREKEPSHDPNNPPIATWAPGAALAKLASRHNNAPCVLTDGPAEFNDVPLIRLSDYEARIAVLFDGYAVYSAMADKAKRHTSPESVAAVLDAVVKLMREVKHDNQ